MTDTYDHLKAQKEEILARELTVVCFSCGATCVYKREKNKVVFTHSCTPPRVRATMEVLLEAVKDALAFLDRPDITTYEWYKLAPDHVAKFRAAIAKAEGK